jgi:hypothetical protein
MMTFLVFLLLLYNAWLTSQLLRNQKQHDKQSEEPSQTTTVVDKQDEVEIVGKSHFKLAAKAPQITGEMPQAASYSENENIKNEDVTFADETEETVSKRVPDEKLDEVFTHVVIPQIQPDDEDEEMDNDSSITGLASGASFDEIGQAMKVADSETETKEERLRAGQVFKELEGNELFNQLIESSSQRAVKIKELMDSFLGNSITREGEVAREAVQLQNRSEDPAAIRRFDIRDFV